MNMQKKIVSLLCTAALVLTSGMPVHAADIAHDPARDVQEEGVGNPFQYGDRNTPADASTAEIRAINHAMTVQEVKYALYKEIDEHWDLITVRFGQTDREKVYALFLGLGSRESTLGGNGDGADIETAFSEGFGVSSAHAYGTMQTAVTAFQNPGTSFMPEDDVPEMEWYMLSESNFYDAIVSNHMGIRKVIHFITSAITDYDLDGYQVVRNALKGFNTGWADDQPQNPGYYADYPDEIIALAQWYYEEGHLYDNVFTWTNAPVADQYRNSNPWENWWYDTEPSLAGIIQQPDIPEPAVLRGDVNLSGTVEIADAVLLCTALTGRESLNTEQAARGDLNGDGKLNVIDLTLLKQILLS